MLMHLLRSVPERTIIRTILDPSFMWQPYLVCAGGKFSFELFVGIGGLLELPAKPDDGPDAVWVRWTTTTDGRSYASLAEFVRELFHKDFVLKQVLRHVGNALGPQLVSALYSHLEGGGDSCDASAHTLRLVAPGSSKRHSEACAGLHAGMLRLALALKLRQPFIEGRQLRRLGLHRCAPPQHGFRIGAPGR